MPFKLLQQFRRPGFWLAIVAINAGFLVFAVAQDGEPQQADGRVIQIEGPSDVAADSVRFEAIDVFVDAGRQSLAAYQLEIASETDGVEIVGIEGGEHAAFRKPPYYDPKAMRVNRVILAAFTTDEDLPSGRTRVARIQLQLQGPGMKEYRTKLSVSADAEGKPIDAQLQIERTKA